MTPERERLVREMERAREDRVKSELELESATTMLQRDTMWEWSCVAALAAYDAAHSEKDK